VASLAVCASAQQLNVICSVQAEWCNGVATEFQRETGIKVGLTLKGSGESMAQVAAEKANPKLDIWFGGTGDPHLQAAEQDLTVAYKSPLLDQLQPWAQKQAEQSGHRTVGLYLGVLGMGYNTELLTKKKLAVPACWKDLAKPEYKDLLVVESPATSSPGLAFLLGTVAHFGADGWQAYWTSLKDNGVKVTGGWTDAYTVDFSGSSGKGARPLVVSYASSPPSEVPAGATSAPTGALLDTCFRQVEYAGVLQGAKNPAGAQQVIDFLLSPEFQATVADSMYVYPVDGTVPLPAAWQQYAPVAPTPATLDPATIAANRDAWISSWSDLLEG